MSVVISCSLACSPIFSRPSISEVVTVLHELLDPGLADRNPDATSVVSYSPARTIVFMFSQDNKGIRPGMAA
jgi:hypothetical protein